jgi:hypothetical protein
VEWIDDDDDDDDNNNIQCQRVESLVRVSDVVHPSAAGTRKQKVLQPQHFDRNTENDRFTVSPFSKILLVITSLFRT